MIAFQKQAFHKQIQSFQKGSLLRKSRAQNNPSRVFTRDSKSKLLNDPQNEIDLVFFFFLKNYYYEKHL